MSDQSSSQEPDDGTSCCAKRLALHMQNTELKELVGRMREYLIDLRGEWHWKTSGGYENEYDNLIKTIKEADEHNNDNVPKM